MAPTASKQRQPKTVRRGLLRARERISQMVIREHEEDKVDDEEGENDEDENVELFSDDSTDENYGESAKTEAKKREKKRLEK